MSNVLDEQQELASLANTDKVLAEGTNPAAGAAAKKPAAKKPASRKKKAAPAAEAAAPVKPFTAANAQRDIVRVLRDAEKVDIMVHESANTPSDGVFVSINGHAYKIQPGSWVTVPVPVVSILANAVEERAITKNGTIVGYRKQPRIPFSVREATS